MKKGLFYLAMLLPASLLAQNSSYTLKGKIGQLKAPAMVYLGYNNIYTDSAVLDQGKFEFKVPVKNPVLATLTLGYSGKGAHTKPLESMVLYLEPGTVLVESPDSLVHAVVSGPKLNPENQQLRKLLAPTDQRLYALNGEYLKVPAEKKKDKTYMTAFMGNYISRQKVLIDEQNQIRMDFIRKNPASLVSLDALKTIDKYRPEYSVVSPFYDLLAPAIKSTGDGKAFAAKLAKMKVMEVGSLALPFTQNDTEGKPVNLSDFRGQYLLIDFWASWCHACRVENPNVVKAYNKYHPKGLEILGVSLDNEKTKKAWLAAIKSDGLIWKHVSDLKGWRNEVALLYGVKSAPQNLLLDKTGRIIAKNLRAEELEAKLAQLLK